MIPVLIIVIISFVAFSVLHRPLIQLSESALQIAYGVSTQMENGLRAATEAVRNWWRRNFANVFTLPAFLGGLILFSFILAFVIADYSLLVMSVSSLFPLEAGQSRIFGLTLNPAGQIATAIVAGELLFGFLIFELLGVSKFMPWDQDWTMRQRRIVASVAAAALICLAFISAGMAAWRTNQMQQIRIMESAAMSSESFDISGNSSYLTDDTGSLSYKPVTIKPSFLDRLPTPVAAAVGLIVSFALAVAGIGIYWFLLGFCGILSAIFVLLPMLLITWMAGIVTRIINSLYVFVGFLLRVLAVPVRIGTRHLAFQDKIDDDSILSLETSRLGRRQNNTRPPAPPGADNRGTRQRDEAPPDQDSQETADTVSYTRDLEEEVAEYRNRDRRRAHNNTINPLGIVSFSPEPTNTEEDE